MARRGELKLSILSASDSLEDDAGDVKTRPQFRCGRFALTRKTVLASTFAVSLVVAAVVVCSVMLPPLFNRPSPPLTPPPASVRLLVVGDSGVGDQMQMDVARQMSLYATRQGLPFDALLHVGDAVYFDGDPQLFYDRITVPYLSPLQASKFFIALGNHDTKWSDGGASMLEFVNMSARYYEHIFRRSNGVSVQLIVLDSNSLAYWWRNPGILNQTFTAEQASFLDAKLAHGFFTWRIVSFHHPVYSCASHKSTPNVSSEWMPIIARRGNVDLVLSGHDHNYQRFQQNGTTFVVCGGGGIRTEPNSGCPPGTPEPQFWRETNQFMAVHATATALSLVSVDFKGQTIDAFTISRK